MKIAPELASPYHRIAGGELLSWKVGEDHWTGVGKEHWITHHEFHLHSRLPCARKRPFTSARDAWMRLAATFHYRL